MVMPFHQRLAELWVLNKHGPLSELQMREVQQCLHLNYTYVWDLVRLENLSLMASMTGDTNWLHDICAEIDFIETDGRIRDKPSKRKKPGQNGTDQ